MANEYDGDIKLAVDLSPESAEKSAKKLQKDIQDIFSKTSGKQLDNTFQKMLSNMSKAVSRSQSLQQSLQKVSDTQIQTKEYTKLESTIASLEQKIEMAKVKQAQFLEAGGKESSRTYENMNSNIALLEDKLFDAQKAMETLVKEGKQFTVNDEGIERAKNALVDNNNQLRMMIEAANQYSKQFSTANDDLAKQAQEMLQIHLNAGEINSEVGETTNKLKEVENELAQLNARQQQLEQAGAGLGYKEYDNNLHKIRELEEEHQKLNSILDEYRQKQTEATDPAPYKGLKASIMSLASDIKNRLSSIDFKKAILNSAQESIPKVTSLFSKLRNSIVSTSKASNGFGNGLGIGFKKVLAYGFGIRSLFVLFRKLRGAITEGIQNLAQFNGGANSTNAAMSSLMSSLNYLKNSWGAAFSPIITLVQPLLSKLINMLAQVANSINSFISGILGRATTMVAKKTSANYAASLNKSGGGSGKSTQEKYEAAQKKAQEKYDKKLAATEEKRAKAQAKAEEKQAKAAKKLAKAQKEANGQLASFDELNVLTTEDMEDFDDVVADTFEDPELEPVNLEDFMDGGGAGLGDLFEEIPVEPLSDKWKEFFQVFKDAWDSMGQKVVDSWKYALESVKKLIDDIGDSFLKVWTNGTGFEFLTHILSIVANIGMLVGNLASQFDKAWTTNDIGTQIIQHIFDIFNSILGTIDRIIEATANWAATLDFYPLLQATDTLLQAIKPLIDNIGQALEFVWTEILLPLGSWAIEDVIPAFLKILAGALDILNASIDAIKPLWQWLWDNLFKKIASWTGGIATKVLEALAKILEKIGDWIEGHEWIQTVLQAFSVAIVAVTTALTVYNAVIALTTPLTLAFTTVLAALTSPVTLVIIAITALIAIGIALYKNWDLVVEKAGLLKDKLLEAFGAIKDKGLEIWTGFKEGLKGILNSIIAGIEGMVNAVINGINIMIGALNNLNFDIPDWVPALGGKTFGLNIPTLSNVNLPRLAQGAVIPPNKEFLAVLGDQNSGTNIEAPLDTIKQALAETLQTLGGTRDTSDIVINIDGKEVFRVVREQDDIYRKSNGNSAFSY